MDETRFVRVSYAFRNSRETGVSYAFRRGLTGDRVNKPFLPSYVPVGAERERPTIHKADNTLTRALCGAEVIGVLTRESLECPRCAEILEGRKG